MHDLTTNTKTIEELIMLRLPYKDDFLFVDDISFVDTNKIVGHYTFRESASYYKSHFIHRPETPGVLLIETMGQIGMVSHLIFLTGLHLSDTIFSPMLSTVESSFFKTVAPEQKLTRIGEKIFF
jgi:3-hydroxyacyl-[acyl-carrier-protein] dehydratase